MSEFLSVIEWFDESGTQMVQRIPPEGSGSIKLGSVAVVRDSQAAVFFRDGRGLDDPEGLDGPRDAIAAQCRHHTRMDVGQQDLGDEHGR